MPRKPKLTMTLTSKPLLSKVHLCCGGIIQVPGSDPMHAPFLPLTSCRFSTAAGELRRPFVPRVLQPTTSALREQRPLPLSWSRGRTRTAPGRSTRR